MYIRPAITIISRIGVTTTIITMEDLSGAALAIGEELIIMVIDRMQKRLRHVIT